jgi:hypothetical protein
MSESLVFRRAVPPVLSTVSLPAVGRAVAAGIVGKTQACEELSEWLSAVFGARRVVLTDSGTSALVVAFRMVARKRRIVGIPAFGCPDLVSAALRADVRLRLYDLDPRTLSPDPDSLGDLLGRGVDAIVVVHYFGFPGNLPMVTAMAEESGAHVIEDAAQGAGGSLEGRLLGGIGPLSILSFGRGKGVTGGSGGALVIRDPDLLEAVETTEPVLAGRTRWNGLAAAVLQKFLARPSLYGIPLAIPNLRLGEMVFRPAGEPRGIGCGNAVLAYDALLRLKEEATRRASTARRLVEILGTGGTEYGPCVSIPGGEPGYLRVPAVLPDNQPAPWLGIWRAYPRAIPELPESRPILLDGENGGPGCTLLSRALLTLPTHHQVKDRDLSRIAQWAEGT